MVNHGIPDSAFNLVGQDVFYCQSCRSQIKLGWSVFPAAIAVVTCTACGFTEQYALSFVDPKAACVGERRGDGYEYLFAAVAPGIGSGDVVICTGCLTRWNIAWWKYSGPVIDFQCENQVCRRTYKLVMSQQGRSIRGFVLR